MGWKAKLSLPVARWAMKRLRQSVADPRGAQQGVLDMLLAQGARTAFGQDHGLRPGLSVAEFQSQVPVRDYEGMRPYMNRAVKGNWMWFGLGCRCISAKPVAPPRAPNTSP